MRTWGSRLFAIVDEQNGEIGKLADATFVLPATSEPMTPLLTLLPLHQLSLHLADQKVVAGYQRPKAVP